METVLENLIVGLIVGFAAACAGARYLPRRWREHAALLLTRCGMRQAPAARWFNVTPGCGAGCGSCNGCGPEIVQGAEKPVSHPASRRQTRR
jgi:hypothetical protein